MSRATSLATLRDCISRLKRVRVTCGKTDDDSEQQLLSTGNIFEDNINKFVTEYKAFQEFVEEKRENMKKFGNDRETITLSQDIRKKTKELEEILAEAKKVIDEKEKKLVQYNLQLSAGENKKIQKKHDRLKEEYDKCNSVYKKCLEELNLAKEGITKTIEKKEGGRNISPGRKKRIEGLRENIDKFNRRKQNGCDAAIGIEMSEEDKIEYDTQMKEIKEKDAIIDKSLDRIKAGVERLSHVSINIGVEVESQNRMLDRTEGKVDVANKDMRGLNRGLTKLMREQKPLTIWLKVAGLIFIVAIIGFFLYQFNIV
jgi:hypothetical protein